MSIGWGLLKSVISDNIPLTDLYEQGIDETFFIDSEKAAFEFIKDFKQKHHKYPQLHTVAIEAGSALAFDSVPDEPLSYWTPQIRERKQFYITTHFLHQLREKADKQDTKGCIRTVREFHDTLLATESNTVAKDLQDYQLEVIEEHNRRQLDPTLPGISYGFPSLDEITGGNQPGDLNLIVGETGVCKSYLSSYMALSAHQSGANVILVSPEMPGVQAARRMLAMQGKFKDRDLKRGFLSYFGVEKAKNIASTKTIVEGQEYYFKILPSGMASDISRIITLANEYNPDMLVVDGIYLIKNPKLRGQRWEVDESIYYILKDFALSKNIPVLATTQYNKTDPKKLQGARGTQSASQVASTFLSLEFENEEDRETNRMEQTRLLKTKKSRDGDKIALRLQINFNTTQISEDMVISGPEYLQESQQDLGEDPHHIETL